MKFPNVESGSAHGSCDPPTSPDRNAATDGLAPQPVFSVAVSFTDSTQLTRQRAKSRFLLRTSFDQDGRATATTAPMHDGFAGARKRANRFLRVKFRGSIK